MNISNLPTAYDPAPVEAKWYRRWEEAGLFHARPDPSRPPFCITIPPPNVNGELHMGHALQHCIHDLLARWHRMQGEAVLIVPGTDHASIATNRAVEKKLHAEGASRLELGREEFLRRCWEWTHQVAGTIIRQLKSLGCSYDWEWGKQWTKSLGENWTGRFTMDDGYARAVLEAFVRFYEKGWIYRGTRVINWCPHCLSTVSDLEVDHEDTHGHLWHIRYPLTDGSGEIVVATTRPETMLGDTAVAVHAEDARYQSIIGKNVMLPLMNREIPVIGDATGYVNPAFGSGAVKVTPAHDLNDFEAGLRHKLPSIIVIGLDGSMTEEAGAYAGLDRYKARKRVVADLEAGGFLVKVEPYSLAIGKHDRCDTVIEPLLSEQWFLSMKELARMTKEAISGEQPAVKFIPNRYRDTSLEWLENIRDWNISRQIWWGHRIPIYYCQACGKALASIEPPTQCPCGGTELIQDEDTLDTWFSSALWPFAVLGWPDEEEFGKNLRAGFFPTFALITAREIIYLWVLRMIMTSLEFTGQIPFHQAYIHPVVMDIEGRRMSKSLGIGLDPIELINRYGADATRFGILYQCATTQDIRFGEERVEAARNFCNKIWNAARFVLSNLDEEFWAQGLAPLQNAPELIKHEGGFAEQWILGRLDTLTHEVQQNFARFRFDEVARGLQEFFWGDFCDWYLELAKPGLAPSADPSRKKLVQVTLVFVLERVLRLLHPYLPFITEEIWQQLPCRAGSPCPAEKGPPADQFIMTAPYPTPLGISFPEADGVMGRLMALVTAIRRLRAERKVPAKEWVNVQIVSSDPGIKALLAQSGDFAHLVHSRQLELVSEPSLPGSPDHIGPADLDVARAHTGIDMTAGASGLADIYLSQEANEQSLEVELARLKKDLEAAQIELERTDANLANEGFTSRAPANVIEKTRQRRDKAAAEVESLRQAIARLEGSM